MIDSLLHARLQPVLESRKRIVLWRAVAVIWIAAAAATWFGVWLARRGSEVPLSLAGWLMAAAAAATAACGLIFRFRQPDPRRLARELEARHPELDGRLLTAIQQVPDKKGDYSFLQERLFEDAVRHSVDHPWEAVAPGWHAQAGRTAAAVAAAACFAALAFFPPVARRVPLASTLGGETTADGVTVTPGDASIERGTSFTVMARFDHSVPASADLVVGATTDTERRVPLVRGLADPVFGGSLPEVTEGFVYRVEYRGRRTRDFKVSVYEHPRLERSDAELTPPAYTSLPPQRIEDTRRISAVEGTRLTLSLQLNKPVARASLVPKDRNTPTLTLTPDPARAVALLPELPLTISQSYELQLIDADGRANKVPDLFVIEALPNRPPELKLTSPRGDLRPSALQEIVFEGTAWDDFGVLAYGLGLARGGQPAEIIPLGQDVPAKEKAAFFHLLQLESLNAQPDELYSWFVWADDIGPDGERRRTQGDLFFAEVRPFDEIFRQGAGMDGGESPPSEQGESQGSPATRLAELQKQIINATWKLQRSQPPAPTLTADTAVVRDSQQQALDQATEAAGATEEPMRAALWNAATSEMEKSLDALTAAATAPAALSEALAAEQSAYQALLKLRERETEVNRSRQQPSGQASSGEQQRQDQLEELDLEQSENRYETERQAAAPQDAERRTRSQVQNRLQELARRQEDVNERLQEMQAALQTADEAQREELRRQLKRLEEEQRQMLADMDELRQRMDRPETQSSMAAQRQQLEQTRQDAQRAAEAAAQGNASQALAAGTRTQRQLEEMREELRRESAGPLAEELRTLRAEARDLARRQQEITESLGTRPDQPRRPSLSDSPEQQNTLDTLESQRARAADLVDRATRLSDESEGSEPLVSRTLYDALRQFSQADATSVKQAREELLRDGAMTRDLYRQLQELQETPKPGQTLRLTSELVRAELDDPARRAARQAENSLDSLRSGVEQAAEKILGDDTAALQAAEKELEALASELAREAAAQAPGTTTADAPTDPTGPTSPTGPSSPTDPSTPGTPGTPAAQTAATSPRDGTGTPPAESADDASARRPATAGQLAQEQPGEGSPDAESSGPRPPGESPSPQGSPGEGTPSANRQAAAGPAGEGPPEAPSPDAPGGAPGGGRGGSGPDAAERLTRLLSDAGGPDGGRGGTSAAPIQGEGFTDWSDRLREVEEMIEFPDLRHAVASARERARVLRLEAQRAGRKPDWAVVELEILNPLVEVRRQVREELRRRSSDDPLAPIDRDPVPDRFADLVRQYYEELGRDP